MTPTTKCKFSPLTRTCAACGYKARALPCYRLCKPPKPKRRGMIRVGDAVEKMLTAVGITKERVERITRTAGKPGGCGCKARQKWLNEAGFKVQGKVIEAAKAYSRFVVGE